MEFVLGDKVIYALKAIDSKEFICLLQEGVDFIACFTRKDVAIAFRATIAQEEFVDVIETTINAAPFHHFYLDGEAFVISK